VFRHLAVEAEIDPDITNAFYALADFWAVAKGKGVMKWKRSQLSTRRSWSRELAEPMLGLIRENYSSQR
jgi:hypothetical protein